MSRKSFAQQRAEARQAPQIETPRSALVPLPLQQRFEIRWASQALSDEARYRARYAEQQVSLSALLGDALRERAKYRR